MNYKCNIRHYHFYLRISSHAEYTSTMERCGIRVNLNNSNLNGVASRNNTATFDKQSHIMDLKRLSSSKIYNFNSYLLIRTTRHLYFILFVGIIYSDNVTRQGLNKKSSVPTATVITDDDDQFFNKIKSEIDKNLLS